MRKLKLRKKGGAVHHEALLLIRFCLCLEFWAFWVILLAPGLDECPEIL